MCACVRAAACSAEPAGPVVAVAPGEAVAVVPVGEGEAAGVALASAGLATADGEVSPVRPAGLVARPTHAAANASVTAMTAKQGRSRAVTSRSVRPGTVKRPETLAAEDPLDAIEEARAGRFIFDVAVAPVDALW